jgi:hypothetical protein
VPKAHLLAGLAKAVEPLWGGVFDDRKIPGTGTQILANGHNVDTGGSKFLEEVADLLVRFAEAEHQSGFREEIGVPPLHAPQQIHGPLEL